MVSCFSGSGAWLIQRLSALYLLLFSAVFAVVYSRSPGTGYQAWQATFAIPAVRLGSAFFFAALLLHAWVGMRDVVLDYVPAAKLRFALLFALAVWLLSLGFWAGWILSHAVNS